VVLAALRSRYAANEDLHEHDLVFTTVEEHGRIIVAAASGSGRFGEAFLRRTRDHFVTLTAGISANPNKPIDRLPLLPDAERTLLLEEFNRTDRDWGSARTIAQYFEARAAAHPDHIAVRLPALDRDDMSHDETWTYGVLNARANQLARTLVRDHGVGPDVRVGVLAERSLEMVLALMAIEKAGGAYVPMDPEYPGELLQFMIEDSGATVILAQRGFFDRTAHAACPVVELDAVWERITTEDDSNVPSRVTGDNLAYVIYTSGSTGRPKGAMNTHAGIANRLLWMQDAYTLTEHDRVLQKTPFSFDVSVWEFFWPLMVGAQLVVARPGGHRDAAYLMALIEHAAITTLHFVPSMLQAFIEETGIERCHALKRVVCSGEAITPELLRRYLSRVPVPLHNLYGPTEAAVDVTAWPCTAADTQAMVPIGTPIANIRLYILDPLRQPVPLGVTGELFLGGVGVGRGYLNRPELTAEKFIPDPFRASDGARLYRTGDLARYRDNGVVDFLGRIDHQVKLRGFRIELGEIESALLAHATVRECVVLVREDKPGAKRLVAYVVPQPGTASDTTALRAYLRQRLPDHMVPGVIVTLADLPRLTNGKLDRKALPIPEDVVETARRHVAPRDSVERRLVRVWEDVLGQKMIGVMDDFFELGGHSLLALKLAGAIHVEFGRSLPLAQLLGNSTVERLAVVLKREHDPEDWRPLVAIRGGRAVPPLFLLPGAGGNVLYFHTLAQVLTTTRPIYGLQALGLDGRTPPLTTVEAIAAANIEEMRRVQPHGPYFLAGHSFGGRVALEMAQQLAALGESIGLLAVLDTAAPTFDPAAVGAGWLDAHWLAKIAREIEEFFGIRLEVTLDDLLPLPLEAQLVMVVSRMQEAGAWAPGANPDQLRGYLQVYKAHSQAAYVRYDNTCTRVPIALFKSTGSDPDDEATPAGLVALNAQHDWGWSQFARGVVRVYDVPGAHLSMLTPPHVPALAKALDHALATAEVPA
jgi:amino acid adenylation domain-containing protein